MATLRQILANRRNCRASCGARTPEGRAASARNSTVHGLTATTMPHEDELPLIEKCREEWLPELHPEGLNQTWWADRFIAATARILWAEQQEDAWRFRKAERARLNWSGGPRGRNGPARRRSGEKSGCRGPEAAPEPVRGDGGSAASLACLPGCSSAASQRKTRPSEARGVCRMALTRPTEPGAATCSVCPTRSDRARPGSTCPPAARSSFGSTRPR